MMPYLRSTLVVHLVLLIDMHGLIIAYYIHTFLSMEIKTILTKHLKKVFLQFQASFGSIWKLSKLIV